MFNPKGILFDLDGTLVDSVPDIGNAANLMLTALDMPNHSDQLLQSWVGNGTPQLVKRALTGSLDEEPQEQLFNRALGLFQETYAEHIFERSRLYPGVFQTLGRFASVGIDMACVTNKPTRHTGLLLEKSGIAHFFSCTVAGDTLAQRKPEPEQLLHAAALLGLKPDQCVMVGDSQNDIVAAKAAGMPVLCLTYGYNQGQDLSASQPDVLVDTFGELTNWISLTTKQI